MTAWKHRFIPRRLHGSRCVTGYKLILWHLRESIPYKKSLYDSSSFVHECNNSKGFYKSICSIKCYWQNILHLKIGWLAVSVLLILYLQRSITCLFSFHAIKHDASHYSTSNIYLCSGMGVDEMRFSEPLTDANIWLQQVYQVTRKVIVNGHRFTGW